MTSSPVDRHEIHAAARFACVAVMPYQGGVAPVFSIPRRFIKILAVQDRIGTGAHDQGGRGWVSW